MGNNYRKLWVDGIRNNWPVLVLFTISFLLYSNSITSNYNLDDELVTIAHPLTSLGIEAIPDIFSSYYFDNGEGITYGYRPIVLTSFAVEYEFSGDNPIVSHFVNVLLYSVLIVFLYIFLSRLFIDKKYLILAFATALLFSSHPLHTEVVASIKNREEILALLFVILASLTALKYYDKEKYHYLILVVIFSVAAIFSKKSAIPGIMVMPVFLIIFRPVEWKKLIPLFVAIVLILFTTVPLRDASNNFIFIAALIAFYTLLLWGKEGFDIRIARKFSWELSVGALGMLFLYALITYSNSVFLMVIIGSMVLLPFQKDYRNLTYLFGFVSWALLGRRFVDADERQAFLLLGLATLSFFAKKDNQKSTRILALLLVLLLSAVYIEDASQIFNLALFALIMISIAVEFRDSPKFATYSVAGFIAALAIFTLIDRGPNAIFFVYFSLVITLIWNERNFQSKTIKYRWIIFPVILLFILYTSEKFPREWEWKYRQLTEKQVEDPGSVIRDIGRDLEPSESVFINDIATSERLATSIFILGKYLQLHIFPHPLRFYYGYAQVVKHIFGEVQVWIWLIVYSSLFLTAMYFLNAHPIYSFGVILFLISLAPFSNLFIPVAGMIGERLAFSASLGFCIMVGYIIYALNKRRTGGHNYVFWLLILLIFSLFGIKTISRNKNWKDKLTLFTHDIKYTSESAKMNQLLGSLYFDISKNVDTPGYPRKAIAHFEKASSIYPDNFMYWYLQGLAYQYYGDYQSAIPKFNNVLNLNTQFTDTYFNLAVCSQAVGDHQTAIDNYEKYIEVEPDNKNVYANLSFLYFQIGDFSNSIVINQNAIQRFPNSPNAYVNLGKTYLMVGDTTNAVINLEKGALLDPRNKSLFNNLSNLFYKMNNLEKAVYYEEKASN